MNNKGLLICLIRARTEISAIARRENDGKRQHDYWQQEKQMESDVLQVN